MKGLIMKEDKNIEQILLNDLEYEKFSSKKIEQDFEREISRSSFKDVKVITELKDVPKSKLFTKNSVFAVINKNSKTKSLINGLQAEGFLGSQDKTRERFLKGEIDSFVNGDYFVKFLKAKI